MSCRQNVNPSDELTKRKTKLMEMEWELAAEHERVRKEKEEEVHAREVAEAQQQATLQQQLRENQARVELPQQSASPHSVEVMVYQYDKLFGYG